MTRLPPSKTAVGAAVLMLLAVSLASGADDDAALQRVGVEPAPAELFIGPARHVIIVTIDGLRSDLVCDENTPNLKRMIREGASSRVAQTVKPSLTLPAHSSLVSGVYPAVHGIYWNTYKPERGVIGMTTIFDVAHRAGLRTSLIAGKEKLLHLADHGAVDFIEIEPDGSDLQIMEAALNRLRESGDNLTLIHLPQVDRVGHRHGWDSDPQRKALRRADAAVGELLTFLDEEGARMEGSTVVIVTADHGGHARHHVDATAVDTAIPWIVWGDVVVHRDLEQVSIRATAATALKALDLDPSTLGYPRIVIATEEVGAPAQVVATDEVAP